MLTTGGDTVIAIPAIRLTDRRLWACLAAGAGLAVLIAGVPGPIIGSLAAVGGYLGWSRVEPEQARHDRARAAADLPFAVDILAGCLRCGSPVPAAIGWAADAVGPALGERLRYTARSLQLGAPTAEAFTELAGIPGSDRIPLALARSGITGAALADGLAMLASDLRDDRRLAAQARAQRAGVWLVLPLCLCFLPAFVAAGLLPVIAATLSQVLHHY
jgi:Flp pilus assembly protein TadB